MVRVDAKNRSQYKILFLVVVFFFGLSNAYSQAQVNLKFYKTTEDYNKGKLDSSEVILSTAKTRRVQHEYVRIHDVINQKTGKKDKEILKCWMIVYNGDHYVNLLYSDDLYTTKSFIRFEKQDQRYQTLTIDKDSEFYKLVNTTDAVSVIAGGMIGGAVAGYGKGTAFGPKMVFKDENGEKRFILLFDKTNIRKKTSKLNACSRVNFLTKEKVYRYLLEESIPKKVVKNMTYEEVMDLIKQKNRE